MRWPSNRSSRTPNDGWVSLHNNISWTHFDLAEYPQALDQFERALSVRRRQGDETAIRIAQWSVAKALRFLNRTTEALSIQRALLQAYQDDGESDAYVFEEMAECLLAIGQPQEAKQYSDSPIKPYPATPGSLTTSSTASNACES